MNGVYDAIGTLAAMAHANGDDIDENTFPSDSNNSAHGLDVFHQGHYFRLRAKQDEPRFSIGSPFVFVSRLRNQYSEGQIDERVDLNFAALDADEQDEVVSDLVTVDLSTAEDHEDEFEARFNETIAPTRFEVLRLTHEETGFWNGVLVQDRIFPRRDGFDLETYRDVVAEIRETKVAIGEVLTETIPPLQDDYIAGPIDPEQDKSDDSIAFY